MECLTDGRPAQSELSSQFGIGETIARLSLAPDKLPPDHFVCMVDRRGDRRALTGT
jgi:hypothetical protein